MPLDYTHLKVDQTLVYNQTHYLLISNINIPVDEFPQLNQVLARVRQFISQEYIDLQHRLQYQVCATYDLRNTLTGEIRHWSGSFNPRGNRHNILSDFRPYNPDTFDEQIRRACSRENVYSRLRFFHSHTAWVFERLTSAIICLQSPVSANHRTVQHRGLLDIARHGRRSRVHLTFHLA